MKTTQILASLLIASPCIQVFSDEVSPIDDNTTQLDTVKVSADFRQLDLQQIPSAITVVDQDNIANRNANHLESILSLAPNVNFASGASRGRYFQIRGIGERSQFIDPVNPSVGLIIDGIDMTGLGGAATLFDVEQVEILRGPQGTAFGANALAGAINIKSKQPTKETEGYVEVKAGNYNTQGLGGAISGSLSDDVQARFAINQFKTDGYMKNVHLNKEDTNNIQETVARAQVAWLINENNELNFSLLKADIDNGYDAFSLDNTRTTYSDEPGQDIQDTDALSLSLSNKQFEDFDFLLKVSGSRSNINYGYDEDWAFGQYTWMSDDPTYTPDPCDTTQGACLADFDGYSSTDLYLRDNNRNALEARLTSKQAGKIFSNSTDWTIGLYQQSKDENLTRIYTWDGTFQSELDLISTAAYVELSTTLSHNTAITYGLRVENSDIKYQDSNNISEKLTETLWGGKITIDQMLSYEHMAYISIARGYKAGGINSDPDVNDVNRTFDTEINNVIETGLKSSLLSDTLTTRIAAFYTQRLDQQAKSSYATQNPDLSFDFQDFLSNAAEGKNLGIELESSWLLSKTATWNTAIGYLETEFVDYSYTNEDGFFSKTGRSQAHAPIWSASTSLDISINKLSLTIEAEAKDEFYYSDSHDEKSEPYALLNAKLEYQHKDLILALTGKNLTGKEYATRGFGFGNDPRNGYTDSQHIQFGDPRLITLQARYSF